MLEKPSLGHATTTSSLPDIVSGNDTLTFVMIKLYQFSTIRLGALAKLQRTRSNADVSATTLTVSTSHPNPNTAAASLAAHDGLPATPNALNADCWNIAATGCIEKIHMVTSAELDCLSTA
jgi:hypothetical protein